MIILLFKIGFLEVGLSDLLDILLMALLIYQLYRIVRGSLAFYIFFGIIALYLLSLMADAFEMPLMSGVLGQFVNIGVLGLLIVFQPEVRRFLLQLGKNSDIRKLEFWRRFNIRNYTLTVAQSQEVEEVVRALQQMSESHTGALLVIPTTSRLQFFANTGVSLQAQINADLLLSIFHKNGPLHDGAVIISDGRIQAARCVLPVSENTSLPAHLGLRHRSAVGITEVSDATALVVSEENGTISSAKEGQLRQNLSEKEIRQILAESLLGRN
jgi:diadenylate cyclase